MEGTSGRLRQTGGMACFNPDGSKYVQLSYGDSLDIFDFDRCTGELSNHIFVSIPDSLSLGCAFSSNGQFLYVSQLFKLYQLDMFSSNIPASLITVGVEDGWIDPKGGLPGGFFVPQLAADNKIYISTWNSTYALHRIEQPDNLGIACDFQQHSFDLPSLNLDVPNFPNYDLGPLGGSGCDTLYSHASSNSNSISFKIFPNPSSNWLQINYQVKVITVFELFDSYGRITATVTLYPYFKNRMLNVSHLAEGIYIGNISQDGKGICYEKIIVQH